MFQYSRITRRTMAIAAAATLIGGLAGCSKPIPDTIKIGVVAAQSGPFANRGKDILRGAQMAADELNAAGYKIGTNTVKVEIIHYDDKGEPDVAAQGAKQLLDDGAMAIIGPLNTPQGAKAIPVVAEAGKPHLFTVTAAAAHGWGKGNTFRLLANDDLQARALASLARETLRAQRIFVVYEAGDYGKGLNSVFNEVLSKNGIKPVGEVAVETKAEVTAEIAGKIKAADADVVMLFSREPHLKGLYKGLQEVGHTQVSIVGTNVIRNRNVAASPIPVKALWATATAIDPEEFINGRAFVTAFEAKYKERPVWGAHYAYDAVFALTNAAARAESVQPADLITKLKTTEPRTRVNQQMRFDESGEQRFPTIGVYRADGGSWQIQMTSSIW